MFSANSSQVSSAATYIEDVFSTYLYTGSSSAVTVTNNIDFSTYGGLAWIKGRNDTEYHQFVDTVRGGTKYLQSGSSAAQVTDTATTFSSTGFTVPSGVAAVNRNTYSFVSWTFRKQPKFFDVVTYTGTGANRTIAHSLGAVPGFMIVKRTDAAGAWTCYHTSIGNTKFLPLNATNAAITNATIWNNTDPTSTVFTVGTDTDVNASGGTYVAYLFAHDAGGFGLTGTDNVISCGSFTTDGSGNFSVNLGYEPQWILVKRSDSSTAGSWWLADNMRGWDVSTGANLLAANSSNAEYGAGSGGFSPNATGFSGGLFASATYIYIAIRRGPMKTPTSGTSVFSPTASSAATGTALTTGFPVDMQIAGYRAGTDSGNWSVNDRLRGVSTTTTETDKNLITSSTAAEATSGNETRYWNNTGFQFPSYWGGVSSIFYNFRRAPGFFDEVCYTGTGVARTVNHNLGVIPELMIVKRRSTTGSWVTYAAPLGNTQFLSLNLTSAAASDSGTYWNSTTPTATVFSVGTGTPVNGAGDTLVAYLFATVAGVSKVGSYTGTGTTKQIDCGFTGGARFVLIKRTDSTGDWYVWDSARGIVAGNDPYLLLNSTAAEVTNTDYVDTYNAGFEISSTAPAAINANGGTFIFLAIA